MKVCDFKAHRIVVLIAMISFCSFFLSLAASSVYGVPSCGGVSDDCYCTDSDGEEGSNQYPCCLNDSNCTWWAWHSACCGWGIAIPKWGHAQHWINAAYDDDYELLDHPVVGSIAVNTTAAPGKCWYIDQWIACGHVAWVTGVDGDMIDITEMACDIPRGGYWQNRKPASYFDGGFIVAKNPNSCLAEVGTFEDGTHPLITLKIRDEWNDHKDQNHDLGCPINNGSGTRFVHDIFGVLIQDYYQPDPGQWYSDTDDGKTAILYNVIRNDPYLLRSGFWGTYKCLKYEDDYNSSMGGATLLGAPKSNEYVYPFEGPVCSQSTSGSTVQQFEKGCMWWDGQIHVHLDQPPYNFDIDRAKEDCPGTLDILPNPWPEDCDSSDMCLNMGCSLHEEPLDGSRFKTPSTGSGVYYGRSGYKHPFPTSDCYHLLYEDFHGTLCIADEIAAEMDDAPEVCSHGSFIRVSGDSTIYRLENGNLRALCGNWTSSSFQARWGYPFQIALLTDQQHFDDYIQEYPISSTGIYAPGESAPECGDPGYECGEHYDIDEYCWGHLDCGGCSAGKECISGYCVSTGPYCGDGSCDDGDGETCSNCEEDCGPCMELIPGYITSPDDGTTVDNQSFDIDWEAGYASDGSSTRTILVYRINGGEWKFRGSYDTIPPLTFGLHNPGDLIECKVRTRLDADYDVWIDSTITSWVASTDWANIVPTSVVLRDDPIPNACSDLNLDAFFQNSGNQVGDWWANAWLHPAGGDENSPNAIEARFRQMVTLDPGEEGSVLLRIDNDFPLPLASGQWEVTVIVEDAQGIADPNRMTIAVNGSDNEDAQITKFSVSAFSGTPLEVLPGRSYYVSVTASDNYHISGWDLDWRVQGGTWESIPLSYYPDGDCETVKGANTDWVTSSSLTSGTMLDLRFRVWDLTGSVISHVEPLLVRDSSEPSVIFLDPSGGEYYRLNHDWSNQTCIPIDFYFYPGVPINSVRYGVSILDHSDHIQRKYIGSADLPEDGHVSDCIIPYGAGAGDELVLYVKISDQNDSYFFYSNPFTLDFPEPVAPWKETILDQTQFGIPIEDGYDLTSSTMGYSFREITDSTFEVYRNDSRYWKNMGYPYTDEIKISKLTYSKETNNLLGTTVLFGPETEERPENGLSKITDLSAHMPDDYIFTTWHELVNQCDSPGNEPCDYAFHLMEINEGTLNRDITLAQYSQYIWEPSLTEYEISPNNNRLMFVEAAEGANWNWQTSYFRENNDAWSQVSTIVPYIAHTWISGDTINAIRKVAQGDNYERWHLLIDEESGSVDTETHIYNVPSNSGYRTHFAYDQASDVVYTLDWSYIHYEYTLHKYESGTWNEVFTSAMPTLYRGEQITSQSISGLVANNGHVFIYGKLRTASMDRDLDLLVFQGIDEGFNYETGFRYTTNSDGLSLDVDGSLIHVGTCSWNFIDRLCIKRGYATKLDCYDADPCTEDNWNPDTGQCEHPTIQCEQDGNTCNGPEVCDSNTGECVTDENQAIVCDDGDPCNGVESCIEETGECSVSDVPVIDDGYSCTLDECDEETGNVSNTPQDEQCVTGACHSAVCDPSSDDADQETGCVFTELAIEPDNLDCTQDTCDPETGDPVYELIDGNCLIDGVCYANEVLNLGNSCKVCDSESPNQWSNVQNGTNCEDGEYCTVNDSCLSGVCVGFARDCSGQASDLRCQSASCDEQQNTCVVSNFQDGTSCADFDVCDGEETCQSGACSAGTSLDCSDGHDCTTDDCNAETGCFSTIDNGNCLIDNQCYSDGATPVGESCRVCLSSASKTAWTNLPDTIPCNDGNLCTHTDRCDGSGGCGGTEITCMDDPEVCGANRACDGSSECAVSYPDAETSCDDNNLCTYTDKCNGSGGCTGTEIVCADDAEVCGADRACNGMDQCDISYPSGEASCDDENLCSYNDKCSGDGQCLGTAIVCTDDETICGANRSCNGTSKCTVTYPENSISCDDEELCTYDDRCNGSGGCIGTDIACNDDPSICGANRSCNGTSECMVAYPGNETSCDDEDLCTYSDICDGSGNCGGTEITCNDNDEVCGADRECNGSNSCTVTYPGSETSCDDDDLCTYSDQCSGDGACSGTEIVCTDDETICGANRSCDGTDECVIEYPDDQTSCDDTDPCTYADSCNGQGGCLGTEIVCTDDDGICAANRSCNGTDECDVSYPDSLTACNADDNGCTEDDHCDGSGLCVAGTEIPCGHLDDECNTGICVSEDAEAASCQKDPSDHVGNNCGEASTDCSGQDTCDEYGMCQSNDYEEGTACNYEGNPCLMQDSCDGSGVCSDNGTLEDGAYCDEEASGSSRCYDGNCLVMQDGETCDLAASFEFQAFSTTESSINTLSLYPNCNDVEYIGSDAFYFVELDAGNYEISLSTSSSTFDPVLLILNSCDPVNCIAYSDSAGPGIGETLSLSVPSGTRSDNSYIIAIDSTGTAGAYELRIESIEPDGDIDLDDDWDMEADVFDIDEETQEVDLVDQDTESIDGDIDGVDSTDIDFDLDTDLDVPADGDMEGDLDPDSIDVDSSDRESDKDFVDGDYDSIADGDVLPDGDESSTDGDQPYTDGDVPTVDGDETSCDPGTEDCECYGNDTCNNGLTCVNGLCSSNTGGGDDGGCRSTRSSTGFAFLMVLATLVLFRKRRRVCKNP